MRRELLERILIGLCIVLGVVTAVIGNAAGVSALKCLGIGMVISGALARCHSAAADIHVSIN
jgi:hypothetical protein